ncbi:hypothetical protein MHYP_G00037540 [Metynnis hypsauchen]
MSGSRSRTVHPVLMVALFRKAVVLGLSGLLSYSPPLFSHCQAPMSTPLARTALVQMSGPERDRRGRGAEERLPVLEPSSRQSSTSPMTLDVFRRPSPRHGNA